MSGRSLWAAAAAAALLSSQAAGADYQQGQGERQAAAAAAAAGGPAAVAAAIHVFAVDLRSLFGGSTRSRDTERKLGEVIAQNNRILATLGEMTILLNNMGVTVRENVRLELVLDKQTGLMSKGQQVLEVWLAENQDPSSATTAAARRRYDRDLLPGVRDLTRQLMQEESYGFAATDAVGRGMMMELWMSKRLGETRAHRRQVGAAYSGYFSRALDPAVAGSPGKALAEAVARRDRMQAILDEADRTIAAGFTREVNTETRTRQSGRTTYYKKYSIRQTATGNQAAGYGFTTAEVLVEEWEETRERPDIHRHGWMSAPLATAADPVDSGDQRPEGRAAYWNLVRRALADARLEAETLAQVTATLRLYREQAEAVRING